MKINKVKSFSFLIGIHTAIIDIFLTLENDGFEYQLENVTLQALWNIMKKDNENFLRLYDPYLIVSELTSAFIREALEAFVVERDDTFWLFCYI